MTKLSFSTSNKNSLFKRGFDIFFSSFILLFFSPLFLLIALAVFFNSKGQIIYAHPRIGKEKIQFKCYKFRTMYQDADKRLAELLNSHPNMKMEWEKSYKLKVDPRVTPIGKFLRKTSLDELPQFWNVLKGDLSVVGPRPVVQEELDKYFGEKADIILSVRPGLTGLWQVSGRSDIECYSKRIALDEEYVKNRSFLLDLRLIARTIPTMIKSRGAY